MRKGVNVQRCKIDPIYFSLSYTLYSLYFITYLTNKNGEENDELVSPCCIIVMVFSNILFIFIFICYILL